MPGHPAENASRLRVPVIWNEDCLLHWPDGEVWLGVWETGTEVPERAEVLLAAARAAGAEVLPAQPHDDAALESVHDPALVAHLATIWRDWEAGGYVADYGRRRVVPYVFPTAGLLAGLPPRLPAAVHARPGLFCYDTMTLVGPGSWAAIRAAADAALTAADLVAAGRPVAYALCRPPGHHAGPAGVRRVVLPEQRGARRPGAARGRESAGSRSSTSMPITATGRRRSSTTGPMSTTAACTSTRARAGSRTTRASPTSAAPAAAQAPTGTCRWPRSPGTRRG